MTLRICQSTEPRRAPRACRSVCVFGPGGEHLHTIPGCADGVAALCWVSEHLLAAAVGARIDTWHVTDRTCKPGGTYASLAPAGVISHIAAAPDGRWLAAACSSATVRVTIWWCGLGPSDGPQRGRRCNAQRNSLHRPRGCQACLTCSHSFFPLCRPPTQVALWALQADTMPHQAGGAAHMPTHHLSGPLDAEVRFMQLCNLSRACGAACAIHDAAGDQMTAAPLSLLLVVGVEPLLGQQRHVRGRLLWPRRASVVGGGLRLSRMWGAGERGSHLRHCTVSGSCPAPEVNGLTF